MKHYKALVLFQIMYLKVWETKSMHDSELVKRIWKYAKKYKWAFGFSYTVLVAELIFAQFLPLLLSDVINSAVYDASRKIISLIFRYEKICN